VATAVREPAPILTVERAEIAGDLARSLPAVESTADGDRDPCEPTGVEPDVRVGGCTLCAAGTQLLRREQVERSPRAALDRLLHCRLEAVAQVEDEIRVLQRLEVVRCELEIVRLRPCGREIDDVRPRSGDALGDPGEWVEARDDRRPAVGVARFTAAAGHCRQDAQHRKDEREAHRKTVARL
jgi:hypothetical protein